MKKIVLIIGLLVCGLAAKAQVEFAYEAGAELVSAYLWRGIYNGGLSFQPTASVGFDHEHVQFRVGAWVSLGASDWRFQKSQVIEEDYNPNTYFIPEVDITASLRSHGVTLGFTHYYYGDGPFFNFGKIENIEGTSQAEVSLGIDGDDWLPEQHHAYINWYTMVYGADGNINASVNGNENVIKRAYSSYLEIGYDYTFTKSGLTLGAQLGIVPWRSDCVYYNEKAAVKCINVKINKSWDLDVCEINLFAQGMIDPDNLNAYNGHIEASGDDKLYLQKVNSTVGLGVWF